MQKKTPLLLVTGFLGSGKTSFLSHFLSCYAEKMKVAVVQNEFAQMGIDSEVLKHKTQNFVLRELYKGSIFCACQFSSFKDVLVELAQQESVDMVLIEATGIADPIAVAQLMEDARISERYYLDRIITVVDCTRFLKLEQILGVKHQVEVADYILLNKTDRTTQEGMQQVMSEIHSLNPFAHVMLSEHGKFSPDELSLETTIVPVSKDMSGELTRCKQGNYVSKVYSSSSSVKREAMEQFLQSLNENILRVKGFFMNNLGETFMVQYTPGQIEILPWTETVGKTQLISIGFEEPDFGILE